MKLENKGDLSFFNSEKPVCCFSYEPFTAFAIPVLLMITLLWCRARGSLARANSLVAVSSDLEHADAGDTWRVYITNQTPFCALHVTF